MRRDPFPQVAGHSRVELLGEGIAGASGFLSGEMNGSDVDCDTPRPAGFADVADVVLGELATHLAASVSALFGEGIRLVPLDNVHPDSGAGVE